MFDDGANPHILGHAVTNKEFRVRAAELASDCLRWGSPQIRWRKNRAKRSLTVSHFRTSEGHTDQDPPIDGQTVGQHCIKIAAFGVVTTQFDFAVSNTPIHR